MLSSICFMPASLMPQSLPPFVPIMSSYFGDSTVVTCMRAGLYQTKKGLLVFFGSLRSRKSMTLAEVSHAGAQRIHASEEGVAPGRTALHAVVVREHNAFLADAVDVGRFPNHQPTMVDAGLHVPNVVAHDDENVRLLVLGPGRVCDRQTHECGDHEREGENSALQSRHEKSSFSL